MKRRIQVRLLAFVLVASVLFAGCAQADMDIVIHSDGSGSISVQVRIDKEQYLASVREMCTAMGEEVTERELSELASSLEQAGYQSVTVDGKEYYQMAETQEITKGKLQTFFGGTDLVSYVTVDTVFLELRPDDILQTQDLGIDLPADAVTSAATVQLPNAIVNTNGTIDAENPCKVSFDGQSKEIFATSKSGLTIDSLKAEIKKLNAVKAPKITKLTSGKTSIKLKFKKVKSAKRYRIQYATKKNFKNAVTKTSKKNVYTIRHLKRNKQYYVRVQAMKKNYAGVTVYSAWTKKSVTTK